MSETTICVSCNNYLAEALNPTGHGNIMMHYLCRWGEERHQCLVGGEQVLSKPLAYCRDVNNGNCWGFKEM